MLRLGILALAGCAGEAKAVAVKVYVQTSKANQPDKTITQSVTPRALSSHLPPPGGASRVGGAGELVVSHYFHKQDVQFWQDLLWQRDSTVRRGVGELFFRAPRKAHQARQAE